MADFPNPRATLGKAPGMISPGDMLYDDMKRRTRLLKEELDPILYAAQNSIEEEAFKRFFLPLFAGEFSSDKAKYTHAISAWCRVAGNPYASVNVVSMGKIVAVVPPIRANILTGKPDLDRLQTTSSMLDDAANHATISPKGAQAMIVNSLHQRYMTNIPRPDLTKDEKAWFDLLNRYGKAPKSMSLKPTAGKAAVQEDDDGLSFD